VSTPQPGSFSALTSALALVRSRRAALLERVALAMHDPVAAEGVAFEDARGAATAVVDATSAALEGNESGSAVLALNRWALEALRSGISLGVVVAALHAGVGAVVAFAADEDPASVAPLAKAASRVGDEVASTAARTLEEQQQYAAKRRADRADRFAAAAGRIAIAAADVRDALDAMAGALAEAIDCDWSAVAEREGHGRLAITALVGRGTGWAQRWRLTEDGGFCGRVISSGQAVATADPEQIGYDGADRPSSIVAAPLVSSTGHVMGVLFAGKDHGGMPDEEEVTVATGLASVGARALETARRFADARRGAAVAERLSESARLAERGDELAAAALVARAAAEAVDADVALVRTVDDDTGELVTRGVHARSGSFAAELEGTRVAAAEVDDPVARRIGERLGADARIDALPIEVDGRSAGHLLVGRAAAAAGAADVAIAARPAAAQAALLVLLSRARARRRVGAGLQDLGEAIVAGGSEAGVGRLVARLVCEGLGAQRAVVYTGSTPDDIEPVAGHGFRREELATGPGRALARDALRRGEPIATGAGGADVHALAAGGGSEEVLSLPLVHEERPVGVVQVFMGASRPDRPATLDALLASAAEAIDRARTVRRRDEDGRRLAALVDIAAKAGVAATAGDTLAAVGAHVATLVPGTTPGVFVLREGRMTLAEPTSALQSSYGAAVATLLRGDPLADAIVVADAQRDGRLSGIASDLARAGVRALLVVPLRFRDEPMGALALASPEPGRFADDTPALLRRQAPPIALALGGALLAASATRSEDELETALASERSARAELAAQETVARVAAEGWPRERAVAAAARAALELLDVDATCLLARDADGGLAAEAFDVAAPSLREPIRRVLAHAATPARGALVIGLEEGRSLHLPDDAPQDAAALLGPLLGPGSTACLVPLVIRGKLIAALAAVSLDPERPVDAARLERAERFAPALALAVAR